MGELARVAMMMALLPFASCKRERADSHNSSLSTQDGVSSVKREQLEGPWFGGDGVPPILDGPTLTDNEIEDVVLQLKEEWRTPNQNSPTVRLRINGRKRNVSSRLLALGFVGDDTTSSPCDEFDVYVLS